MLGALVFLPPAIVLTVVLVATQGADSELIPTVYVVLLMVPAQILLSAMLAFAYGMIEQRRA